ncbi:phage major capsid protein [Sorangium sp. So ce233]|uniref:phage major capsid protein n=1 Tax=Sorangium sp. So ce233 TaxID=3133290 RepID=UPI003F6299AC
MAQETFSDLSSALSQIFSRRLEDQINRNADSLAFIDVVPNDAGKNVAWTAKFSNSKATTVFAEGSDVDNSEYAFNIKVPATLNFGNYRCPAKVTDYAAIMAAMATGSADELMGLVDDEINDSILTLTKQIGTDFFSGTGTSGGNPNIIGVYGGACAATGTYAGINRATHSEWAGNVLGNGGVARPLTDDLLRQAEVAAFNAGGLPPNLILTSGGVHRKYAGLFSSIQRVQTAGAAPAQLGMGTNDLMWNNMPVVRDANATTGKLIMLNTANVQLVVPRSLLPAAGYPINPMTQTRARDGKRQYSIPVIVEPLARQGNSLPFNVWTHVQLRVKRPNACSTIEDISES